ncbi:MAG: ABC transporter substrate-binding protein [Clostridiales bacterium]|jgi:peptide/nickel transport system substrate-binding protein|nr:ABC transporter substrate-binding protein [Clostridiales bacterium]
MLNFKGRPIGKALFIAVTAVLLLSLAACSVPSGSAGATRAPESSSTATETSSDAGVGAETETSPAAAAESAPAEPEYGGVFTISMTSQQTGFDSALFNYGGTSHLKQTANTLIEGDWTKGPTGEHLADFDNSTPPITVSKGALAESWEIIGDDTIIYHIRKGVHFGLNPDSEASRLVNGRELTGADVAYSIRRQFNVEPTAPVPNAHTYARLTPEEFPTNIELVDDWTVKITTQPGYVGAVFYWISGMTGIFAPEVVQKYGDLSDVLNDVGTGPYFLTDFVDNSAMTFKRNDNYWETDPMGPGLGNQLPYLDEVKYLVLPDLSTQLSAFRVGKVDYMRNISLDNFKELSTSNPELKYARIAGQPSGIALRSDNPDLPWYDVKVRQAIQMGIDRQALIKDYYGGEAEMIGYPANASQLLKTLGAYREFESLPAEVQELFVYNPEKAKQMLAEAGYPNGFTIQVILQGSQIDLASILQNQLASIGVNLDLQVKETAVYLSISNGRTHEQAIFVDGFGGTPAAFHHHRPTDHVNTAMIDDPVVNDMIDEFNKYFMIDDTKSWPLIGDSTPYVLEQAWYLVMPAPYTYTMWWPWVKNYSGEYALGSGHFYNFTKYIWIDQALKASMGY